VLHLPPFIRPERLCHVTINPIYYPPGLPTDVLYSSGGGKEELWIILLKIEQELCKE
jgi:hypothetical protein